MSRAPIIHINAYPGVGKLTIAQALLALAPDSISIKLIHNHLLINPADAVLHRSQAGYQKLRRELRSAIFTALSTEPETFDTIYVFTDFQSTNEQGASVCAEYVKLVRERGCELISVVLNCEEGENVRRVRMEGRWVQGSEVGTPGAGKLRDVELLRMFRNGAPVYRFDNSLEIDVTRLEPQEVARRIWGVVGGVWPGGKAVELVRNQLQA